MKPKLWPIALSLVVGPLCFIWTGEVIYDAMHKDSLFIPFAAAAVSVVCVSLTYLWARRTLEGRLFQFGQQYTEPAKRFGIVLGVLIGTPWLPWYWYTNNDPSYVSIVPYLLIVPGIALLGFMCVASLVHAAFWCIDSLRETTPLGIGKHTTNTSTGHNHLPDTAIVNHEVGQLGDNLQDSETINERNPAIVRRFASLQHVHAVVQARLLISIAVIIKILGFVVARDSLEVSLWASGMAIVALIVGLLRIQRAIPVRWFIAVLSSLAMLNAFTSLLVMYYFNRECSDYLRNAGYSTLRI